MLQDVPPLTTCTSCQLKFDVPILKKSTTKAPKAANHEAAKSQWKEERISENRGNEINVSMKREC